VTTNADSAKHFEEKLLQQKAMLERAVLSTVAQGREIVAEDNIDPADQAVVSYQRELIFSQGTSGHNQLSMIRTALERLHEGTFGECLQCGETIGAKRLEALPWTPYCIACQEKIENGEVEDVIRAA
jgi:DnaK suppressor protein